MGILDLNKTVYSLCEEYPQLVGILQGLGFESIGNPIMMKTAARIMTIPKAAQMKGLFRWSPSSPPCRRRGLSLKEENDFE
jgi:hypothetical protein